MRVASNTIEDLDNEMAALWVYRRHPKMRCAVLDEMGYRAHRYVRGRAQSWFGRLSEFYHTLPLMTFALTLLEDK